MTIKFFVPGVPKPGGSKKAFYIKNLGRSVIVEDCKTNKSWRESVKHACVEAYDGDQLHGPLSLSVTFFMPRPKGHFGSGKNEGKIKASAPKWHTVKPDRTKLLRSTEDAITDTKMVVDDTQFCTGIIAKVYSNDGRVGAEITIEEIPEGATLEKFMRE